MLTNLLIIAILQVESGGDWNAIGDGGRALGGLQIHSALVKDYNRATGERIKHAQVKEPQTASRIATWYFGYLSKRYKRTLTPAELYQCWNAGPDAVKRGQSVARGKRVASIYSNLCAKELQNSRLPNLRSTAIIGGGQQKGIKKT